MSSSRKTVLLTGATGYVGGRLLPLLEVCNAKVRCLVRRPETFVDRAGEETGVVRGDVLDSASLQGTLEGIDTAYYLVHSMGSSGAFEDQDRVAAENFGTAAREAGVKRIIYLGGLGDDGTELSAHLRSRREVGEVLRASGVPTIEFRASIVIGSGSLSFELIRALVERLPVMICPKWVDVKAQPIAIEDLLDYLLVALDWPSEQDRIFEIGGPDQVSYGQIMREYAKQRGLKRWMISVPLLTPRLSSLWLGLVTPVYARIGGKLIDSLRNPTIVKDAAALREFGVHPRGLSEAIRRAFTNEENEVAQTRWSDALSMSSGVFNWGGTTFKNRVIDSRVAAVPVPPEKAFAPIRTIGGERGWYSASFLWTTRGWIDLLFGGIGKRRARRDPEHLRVGDVLDWWRVEEYIPNRRLRLAAEMKMPGRAWLEFEIEATETGSRIRQTALFDPIGLFGLIYWYCLFPIHAVIFGGMLRGISRRAVLPNTASP
jgi:uncharacterized protein YbjT (DUF2867 family)